LLKGARPDRSGLPGQPVTVALSLGGWSVKRISVVGAVLTSARLDSSGTVYLVTVAPLEEWLTVTLEHERRVYLPLVLRSY